MERLVCVGPFDVHARKYLKQHADAAGRLRRRRCRTAKLKDALLFVSDRLEGSSSPASRSSRRGTCTSCASATSATASAWCPRDRDRRDGAGVSPHCDIEDSVRGSRIVVGARSVIDSFVKIKPTGGSGDLVIGEHSVINSGCVLYTGNGIRSATTSRSPPTPPSRRSTTPIGDRAAPDRRAGLPAEPRRHRHRGRRLDRRQLRAARRRGAAPRLRHRRRLAGARRGRGLHASTPATRWCGSGERQ